VLQHRRLGLAPLSEPRRPRLRRSTQLGQVGRHRRCALSSYRLRGAFALAPSSLVSLRRVMAPDREIPSAAPGFRQCRSRCARRGTRDWPGLQARSVSLLRVSPPRQEVVSHPPLTARGAWPRGREPGLRPRSLPERQAWCWPTATGTGGPTGGAVQSRSRARGPMSLEPRLG